jgi:hypothetical protein
MIKKIYLALILAVAGIASTNAQVRIGGSEAPNQSAVLDLNPDDLTSEGNATKGLAMLRVRLKNTTNTTYSAGNGLTLDGTTFSIGSGQVNNTMIVGGAVATAQLGDKSVTVANDF